MFSHALLALSVLTVTATAQQQPLTAAAKKPAPVIPPFNKTKCVNTPYTNTPLTGDILTGTINCGGKGFFCTWMPTSQATPLRTQLNVTDSKLRRARNADQCWETDANGAKNDFHCHGSDNDALYSRVQIKHYKRNYNGQMLCQCGWPPVNITTHCDYTGKKTEYDGACPTDAPAPTQAPWIDGQMWGLDCWGPLYINVTNVTAQMPATKKLLMTKLLTAADVPLPAGVKDSMDMKGEGSDGGNENANFANHAVIRKKK